jgi:NitT/TauT family transport system permease protein
VRLPHVMVWTFAAIPNAVAFGLLTVVTTELLTGSTGIGGLMLIATSNVNASLSFAVVIVMSFVGIVLVTAADRVRRAVLHWQ